MTDENWQDTDAEASSAGSLTGTPSGALIEVDLQNLPADGWHGFHIHEEGVCDTESGFKSAGGQRR
ncbi:superoxide dismutase family protein [Roseovarius sp.]|uniref:superoxide dismutase family protein n=1 Tax=Roseovarius sp. TaxID=1486281 RepID=UPI003D0A58DA